MADTIDLGSIPRGCRFKSCYPHEKGRVKRKCIFFTRSSEFFIIRYFSAGVSRNNVARKAENGYTYRVSGKMRKGDEDYETEENFEKRKYCVFPVLWSAHSAASGHFYIPGDLSLRGKQFHVFRYVSPVCAFPDGVLEKAAQRGKPGLYLPYRTGDQFYRHLCILSGKPGVLALLFCTQSLFSGLHDLSHCLKNRSVRFYHVLLSVKAF